MNRVFEFFKEHDVYYERNFKISELSSIKIGGIADVMAFPDSEEKLISTVDFLHSLSMPYKIVGKMSNILVSDDGFRGALISTKLLSEIKFSGTLARAACGALVNSLIFSAAKANLSGFEDLFGIPGTVGGLVHNNGGAGKTELSHAILYARVYSPSIKKILILDNHALKLSYRSSVFFEKDYILLTASFAFIPKEYSEVMQKIRKSAVKRKTTQPNAYPSLGSIFKREGDLPVSKLIDEAGLKGFSVGGAQVSKKHAGFIINRGKATASDVCELISIIKLQINKKYGFEPKEEIEFLG